MFTETLSDKTPTNFQGLVQQAIETYYPQFSGAQRDMLLNFVMETFEENIYDRIDEVYRVRMDEILALPTPAEIENEQD